MFRIFVYGTLLEGQCNHYVLDKVKDTPEPAILSGYAMQHFAHGGAAVPRIYPKEGCGIVGEVYNISNIEHVDCLERGYVRKYSRELDAYFYAGDNAVTYLDDSPNINNIYCFKTLMKGIKLCA